MSDVTSYQIRYRVQSPLGQNPWLSYGPPVFSLDEVVTGLEPSTTYELEVTATNNIGATNSSIVVFTTSATAPTAPTSLIPSSITQTSLVLNWSQSSQGSQPISYQVQMRFAGIGSFAPFGSATTTTSEAVTGLVAATSYDFEVVASNTSGAATSAFITVETAASGVAPTAPTGVSVSNQTASAVTLTWTGSSGTAPITYQPLFRVSGIGTFLPFGSPVSGPPVVITGLAPATPYDFEVQAINAAGTNNSTTIIGSTIAGTSPPSPPGALTASNVTPTSLTMTWTASTGTPTPTYQLQQRVGSTGAFANVGSPTTLLTLNVTGLLANTTYNFQVTATNSAGSATIVRPTVVTTLAAVLLPSAPISPTIGTVTSSSVQVSWTAPSVGTPPLNYVLQWRPTPGVLAVPGPPQGVTATTLSTTTIKVTWTAPITGGALTAYTVNFRTGTAAFAPFSPNTTALTQTVTGLTPNTTYNFEVIASNATGNGTASAVATATTAAVVIPPGTGFTIGSPVATPTTGAINVNLTSQTGVVCPQELWGVSQSTNNGTWNASFGDAGWVSAMASLNIQSWRLQGEGMIASIFGNNPNSSTPNFTPLNPLTSNLRTALPNAVLMYTIIDPNGNSNYTTANPSAFANQVVLLANHLEAAGVHVTYWDVFNEPDGQTGGANNATPAQCQTMSAAIFPALNALNKGYKFGTCPTGPQGIIVAPYPQDCINGYPAMNYVAGHWYAGAADAGSVAADLLQGVLGNGPFGQINTGNETYNGAKYPFCLSEYAFGYNGGGSPSVTAQNTNMVASVTYANMLINGCLSRLLFESGVWDGAQAIYGWTNSLATMAPHCFMLSVAGQHMPGAVVVSNTSLAPLSSNIGNNSALLYMNVMATTNGIIVVNASTAASSGSVSLVVGGLQNTTVHRWQQVSTDASGGFSSNAGTTTTITVGTGGVIAAQTYPRLSVTVYYP
jgi:hypothetical protein